MCLECGSDSRCALALFSLYLRKRDLYLSSQYTNQRQLGQQIATDTRSLLANCMSLCGLHQNVPTVWASSSTVQCAGVRQDRIIVTEHCEATVPAAHQRVNGVSVPVADARTVNTIPPIQQNLRKKIGTTRTTTSSS